METGDTMTRRTYTRGQKVALVKKVQSFVAERGISIEAGCELTKITSSSFYVWRRDLFNEGAMSEDSGPSEATIAARHSAIHWERQAESLGQEIDQLNEVITARGVEIARLKDVIVKLSILLLESREIA